MGLQQDATPSATIDSAAALTESGWPNDVCHGIGLAFAVCTAGTKCCGRGTSMDPACYYEEWNECCQPPGSDTSIICAKGQGCAQTENGVPFCVPEYDACLHCADQFPEGQNTYLCHNYGSGTCHHAADP